MVIAWLERLALRICPRGLSRTCRVKRRGGRKPGCEMLETRRVYAADVQLAGFSADGNDLVVDYHVASENAAAFDIGIYESADGVTLGARLQTSRVSDPGQLASGGTYQVVINPDFSDVGHDYFLVAVVDASQEVSESSETNNRQALASGVFRTGAGVVHVHGSESADAASVEQGATNLAVSLGTSAYSWPVGSVAEIRLRLHGGNDTQSASGLSKPLSAWGGAGHDALAGGAANDVLWGGGGDDQLQGGAGDDWLYGDKGQVWAAAVPEGGADQLWGDAGSDWLFGEGGDDDVYGGAGNDYGYGGYGVDQVHSGATAVGGSEWLFGDQGDDELYLESATAYAYDYEGNNTVHAFGSSDVAWSASGGSLTVTGNAVGDSIVLTTEYYEGSYWLVVNGERTDTTANISSLVVSGGAGDDVIDLSGLSSQYVSLNSVTLYGGEGSDQLIGSFASDWLEGDAGDDVLLGYGGNDYLAGGDGLDALDGGAGADTLVGGSGNDTLAGGSGSDYLSGGDDADYLDGGSDGDLLYGGDGDDLLYAEASTGYGGYGYGGYGGYGGSSGYGYGGDQLHGEAGDDELYGASGDDYLYGGYGADILDGAAGNDTLTGGSGHDTFVSTTGDMVADRPTIVDFGATKTAANEWKLRGRIVDDEDPSDRQVSFGGDASGNCLVTEDDWFELLVYLPGVTSGWVYASFLDAEGIMAEEVWIPIS